MAMEGKIPAVKIEFEKDNKVIICVPYNQELIKKIKTIPGKKWNSQRKYGQFFWKKRKHNQKNNKQGHRGGTIYEQLVYYLNFMAYPNNSDITKLSEIVQILFMENINIIGLYTVN